MKKMKKILLILLILIAVVISINRVETMTMVIREQNHIDKGHRLCNFCGWPLVINEGAEHIHCALRLRPFHLHLAIKGWIKHLSKDYEAEQEIKDRVREMAKEHYAK